MSIMDMIGRVFVGETEMAKSGDAKLYSAKVVATDVDRLIAAKHDQVAFEAVFEDLRSDATLKSADIIEIGMRYAIPPRKLTSKAKALAAIDKRFGELGRTKAKITRAGNTRPL